MGGFFGVASREDCTLELFYGVDYHSHLGTRRGGMAVYGDLWSKWFQPCNPQYRKFPVSYKI